MSLVFKNSLTAIHNGDSQLLLKRGYIDNFDKVVTSPPYNTVRPNSTDRGYDLYKDGMSNEEYINWTINSFNEYDKHLNRDGCIIYNMSYGTENTEGMILTVAEILKNTPFTLADILVWKKKCATPNNVSKNKMTRIVEYVFVFCRKSEFYTFTSNKKVVNTRKTGQLIYENLFNFFESKNNDGATHLNKATFSTEFVNNIIDRYVLDTDIVFDPFGGTGTTAYACEQRGIKSISVELSKAQVAHSITRLLNNE